MPLALVGPEYTPPEPRCVVLRAVSELNAALAIANADIPVLIVLHVDAPERQRVIDVLTGWSSGAAATLDWIGAHTVVVRTRRAVLPRLSGNGLGAAVEQALDAAPSALTRVEESRLLDLAVAGSVDARRRLIDAYAEIATVVALWLRPPYLSVQLATRAAHEELDDLVTRTPTNSPTRSLLVDLVNRVDVRLNTRRPEF